jgi:hypothetical protein
MGSFRTGQAQLGLGQFVLLWFCVLRMTLRLITTILFKSDSGQKNYLQRDLPETVQTFLPLGSLAVAMRSTTTTLLSIIQYVRLFHRLQYERRLHSNGHASSQATRNYSPVRPASKCIPKNMLSPWASSDLHTLFECMLIAIFKGLLPIGYHEQG